MVKLKVCERGSSGFLGSIWHFSVTKKKSGFEAREAVGFIAIWDP